MHASVSFLTRNATEECDCCWCGNRAEYEGDIWKADWPSRKRFGTGELSADDARSPPGLDGEMRNQVADVVAQDPVPLPL